MNLFKPYKDFGAVKGEVCPLCGTKMNEGARICTGCRGVRQVKTKGIISAILQGIFGILAGIGFLMGGVGLIVLFVMAVTEKGRANPGEGLLIASYLIGSALFTFLLFWLIIRISPKQVVYVSTEYRG
jgi:apolipoprotein N-acyltransferase